MNQYYIKVERPHLCSPMVSINIVAVIRGNLTETQINQVISKLTIIHPTLNSLVKINSYGKAYLIPVTEHNLNCIWLESDSKETIESVVCEYDKKPFDFIHGPLCRFIVLHSAHESTIIINGHHVLGDGMAYSYLMQDFVRILEDPDAAFSSKIPTTINDSDAFPKKTHLGLLPRILATNLNKSWKKSARQFNATERQQMFEQYHIVHHTAIFLNQVSSAHYETILHFCHQNNISVNTFLATSFEKAAQEVLSDYKSVPPRVGIAVNIRDEVKEITPECMGNYISGIVINRPYDKDKNFIVNAVEMQKMIRKQLKNPKSKFIATNLILELDDTLLDAFQFAAYSDYYNEAAAKLAAILREKPTAGGLGLTNLGKDPIHFANEKYIVDDFYVICPASPSNDLTIGIVSYNNHMNLCLRYNSDQLSEDIIQRIYQNAINIV